MLNYPAFLDLLDLPPNMYRRFLQLMPNLSAEKNGLLLTQKLHYNYIYIYISIKNFEEKKYFKKKILEIVYQTIVN